MERPEPPQSAGVWVKDRNVNIKGLSYAFLLLVEIGLSGCGPQPQSQLQPQAKPQTVRLTVTVDDRGAKKSGSSVIGFYCTESNPALGEMGIGTCVVKGEAVPVDLGVGRYLVMTFAEVGSYDSDGIIGTVRTSRPSPQASFWNIPADKLTLLVTFDDRLKPSTVKAVAPDALNQTFGQGVALESVTAEATDEAVTRGQIEHYLPWLSGMHTMLDGFGGISTNEIKSRLGVSQFERGLK